MCICLNYHQLPTAFALIHSNMYLCILLYTYIKCTFLGVCKKTTTTTTPTTPTTTPTPTTTSRVHIYVLAHIKRHSTKKKIYSRFYDKDRYVFVFTIF